MCVVSGRRNYKVQPQFRLGIQFDHQHGFFFWFGQNKHGHRESLRGDNLPDHSHRADQLPRQIERSNVRWTHFELA